MPFSRLGPTRRKTVGTEDFGIYGFRGGLNVKDVPQDVDDSQLTESINGYLQDAGGWLMRNGMTQRGTGLAGIGATGGILSAARFWQTVKNGASVVPPTVKLLAQVGNTLYDYDNNIAIGIIGTSSSPTPATYVLCADPNNTHTGFSGGTNDVIVICSGSGGPYIYDGVNLYTPAGWADAAGAQWCALVNGIVYFGGIPNNPRIVYGAGDGIIASFETLPGYAVFNLSYPVTGLSLLSTGGVDMLVIGMTIGASILYGTGVSNYDLQDIPSFADGVVSGYSMVTYEGAVYFLGGQAEYTIGGSGVPVTISENIEPWILNNPTIPGFPITNDRQIAFSFVYNNRLHIGYCSNSPTPNVMVSYNLLLNAWDGALTATPGIGCAAAMDAPNDPQPFQMVMGSATTPVIYDWDIYPLGGEIATDAGANIPASMQTKYFKVGVPGTIKSLKRVYPELYVSGAFTGQLTLSFDYGATETNVDLPLALVPPAGGGMWNVMDWNVGVWAAQAFFVPFEAPNSRVDVDDQFESCAFGISTNGGSLPWIFGGITGTYCQQGRT
jgi:hypothetical protein